MQSLPRAAHQYCGRSHRKLDDGDKDAIDGLPDPVYILPGYQLDSSHLMAGNTPSKIVQMRFLRMEGGMRVPYIFEVEASSMLIIKEYRQYEQDGNVVPGTGNETPIERTLRRMQVNFRRDADGGLMISKASKTSQLVDRVLDMNMPCPEEFPNCAKLRQAFAAELDRLPKNEDGKCRDCDSADIRRKYANHLLDMLGVAQ